jgi:anti-sigma factor RsiW
MSLCSQEFLIGRYHDGELDEQSRRQVEQHLEKCEECAGQLAELRLISGLVGRVRMDPMSSAERMHVESFVANLSGRAGEMAVLRIAKGLAAVAACVLVVTSFCLAKMNGPETPAVQSVAVAIPSDVMQGVQGQANSNLSHWMVRNLGGDLP